MRRVIILLSGFLFSAIAGWTQPADWYLRPVFSSDAVDLKSIDVSPLLLAVCPGKVYFRQGEHGPETGCSTCPVGSDFFADRDTPGGVSLQAVTLGHFTSATSDDALLSVLGCESHSNYGGGSFLLTKQSGRWHVLGYYSRLITEQCHVLGTRSGRGTLVCSHYFGAQGLMSRFLYALDFGEPKKPLITQLLTVWNGLYTCGQAGEKGNLPIQQSVIDLVTFPDLNGDGIPDVSIAARTGKIQRSDAEYRACEQWSNGRGWNNPPPVRTPAYPIDYLLQGNRLVLAQGSARVVKHFRDSDGF